MVWERVRGREGGKESGPGARPANSRTRRPVSGGGEEGEGEGRVIVVCAGR